MAKKKINPLYSVEVSCHNRSFVVGIVPATMALFVAERSLRNWVVIDDNIDPCGRFQEAAKEIFTAIKKHANFTDDALPANEHKWLGRMIEALVESTGEFE